MTKVLGLSDHIPNLYDHIPSVHEITSAVFTDEKKYVEPYVNSTIIRTLVPAFVLVLASQKHAPDTQKEIDDHYDYIIVGSGSAGSALAARLSEVSCVKILVLEAGRSPPVLTEVPTFGRTFVGTDIDWNYYTEPQKHTGAGLRDRRLIFPAGKAVGGSSIINAMLFVRGHRKIYDDWARKYGATGWSYDEILPYFKKIEHNMNPEIVEKEFHGFHGPVTVTKPVFDTPYKSAIAESYKLRGIVPSDVNGKFQKGIYDYQSNTRLGQRCSAAKAYLVPANKRENLHIVEKAFVEKVLLKGNRAIGVRVNISGHVQNVYAKREVILSAGAINSPQILMLSGIGPKRHLVKMKIPVIADLPVGRNMQDHLGPINNYYTDSMPPYADKLFYPDNMLKYITLRKGIWASSEAVQYISLLTKDLNAPIDTVPDYELYFLDGVDRIVELTTNMKREVYEQVYAPYKNTSTLWCVAQNLHARSRGFVELRSRNPYHSPKIDPQYFSDPRDVEDIIAGMMECDRVAFSKPFKDLNVKPFKTLIPGCEKFKDDKIAYFRCQIKSVVVTLSHQVGTVRMGNPNDPSTVVDPQLRVKSIKGLRVADASIMPQVPSSNTNIPCMMIGEKAADMIKMDMHIRCEPSKEGHDIKLLGTDII